MDERNDYNSIPMQNTQTAVEWLVKQLNQKIDFIPMDKWDEIKDIVQQAKQMEKEQIINAWNDGDYSYFYDKETGRDFEDGKEYYNKIYNQEKI